MNRRIGCWTRMLCAVLCLGVLLGMAPCAAAEEAVHGEEKPFGVPVELTGVMLGSRQVYLGVGEEGSGGSFYLMKAQRQKLHRERVLLSACVRGPVLEAQRMGPGRLLSVFEGGAGEDISADRQRGADAFTA